MPYLLPGSARMRPASARSRSARRACFALSFGLASFFSRATLRRWRRSRSALVIAPDFFSGGWRVFRFGRADTKEGSSGAITFLMLWPLQRAKFSSLVYLLSTQYEIADHSGRRNDQADQKTPR